MSNVDERIDATHSTDIEKESRGGDEIARVVRRKIRNASGSTKPLRILNGMIINEQVRNLWSNY